MNRHRGRTLFAVAVGVGVAVLVTTFLTWLIWLPGTGNFRESFLANLFATLIGVVVAVPAGLAIDRAVQAAESNSRRGTLLQSIRNDLVLIGEDLDSRRPRTEAIVPFLGSGLWASVSSSGQITDLAPEQIRVVGRAYDRIAVTAALERELWDLTHDTFHGQTEVSPDGVDRKVLYALVDQDRHTAAAIDHALGQILGGYLDPDDLTPVDQAIS